MAKQRNLTCAIACWDCNLYKAARIATFDDVTQRADRLFLLKSLGRTLLEFDCLSVAIEIVGSRENLVDFYPFTLSEVDKPLL